MDIDFNHNLRHKDMLLKYVKVKTVDSREHEGWLKCIDPITGNLFLMTFDEGFDKVLDTILIVGSAYQSLEVIRETDDSMKKLIENFHRVDMSFLTEDTSERKERLISWIKKHRLPVSENEDQSLLVCESVTVSPPYEIESCSSLNARVLKNIRQLVHTMPKTGDIENHICEE